jgi:hypothetical protein
LFAFSFTSTTSCRTAQRRSIEKEQRDPEAGKSARAFRGDKTEERHQLSWRIEPAHVADLSDEDRGGDGSVTRPRYADHAYVDPNKTKQNLIKKRKSPWISLDSFGGIGTLQRVTANPNKKISNLSLSSQGILQTHITLLCRIIILADRA